MKPVVFVSTYETPAEYRKRCRYTRFLSLLERMALRFGWIRLELWCANHELWTGIKEDGYYYL